QGRLTPVACDFKCGFDRDDSRWQRLNLPAHVFAVDYSDFEQEINQLRTYQGQSDVYVINAEGTILAPTFGGGANSLVTEMLGDDAIISSDFGGNPPYGILGFDSDMSEVLDSARKVHEWMEAGGREPLAARLKIASPAK